MTQRTRAGLLALCLLAVLWATAAFVPLPYVTYYPGPTVDILAKNAGDEIVEVTGHEAYYDDGELRMTTVYVSTPQEDVSLPELLRAYFDPDAAVWPRSSIYAPEETDESSDRQSDAAMVSSQDTAVAAALTQLGEKVDPVVEVLDVTPGLPADGKLEVRDVLLRVGGTTVTGPQDVVDAVDAASPGEPVAFVVRRGKKEVAVDVTPEKVDGDLRIGITPGVGFDFPFQVSVDIADNIGGPSAGLMMSLAHLRHPHPGLADRRRRHRRHRHHHAGRQGRTDRRHPAEDRRRPRRRRGRCSSSRPKLRRHRGSGSRRACAWPKATTMDSAVKTLDDWVADPDASDQLRGDRLMTSPTDPTPDAVPEPGAPDALPEDPALAAAVLEIEAHVAQEGWDQPARLYALVDTATLVAQEPALAAAMAIDGPGDDGSFTPIEQDGLPPGQVLEAPHHRLARERRRVRRSHRVAGAPARHRRRVPTSRPRRSCSHARPHRQENGRRVTPRRGRRTAPCACALTTTSSRWSTAPSWSPVSSTSSTRRCTTRPTTSRTTPSPAPTRTPEAMSNPFDRPSGPTGPDGPQRPGGNGGSGGARPATASRRPGALVITAIVLVLAFMLLSAFASFWTERLRVGLVGYQEVFTTLLLTRIGLFFVFAGLMAAVVAVAMAMAYRYRPVLWPGMPGMPDDGMDRYRQLLAPRMGWVIGGAAAVMGLFAGASASGQWRSYSLWRHSKEFGTSDPYFNKDVGFYVFDLPFWHYIVDFVMALAVVGLIASLFMNYLFGGIRLSARPGERLDERRADPGLRAAGALRAGQGRGLLARPFRPGHQLRLDLHRHGLPD